MAEIGIQLADGSFFPILSDRERTRKRLILSPAESGQPGARVAIIRRQGEAQRILGELVLEAPLSEDDAPLELFVGVDQEGLLTARLDGGPGRLQTMECSLDTEEPEGFPSAREKPESDKPGRDKSGRDKKKSPRFQPPLSPEDVEEDSHHPRPFHWTVLVAILLISLSLLALGAYGFMTFLGARIVPDLRAASAVVVLPAGIRFRWSRLFR
ncbi:hypothetical protein SAMN05920897_11054 [Alkalispirochaeta americana]|uniref:Uncharacterized protein n=1 Tax=Alkalispirochaeta americana TaxID=159291 RepID=A0A1N6TGP4_9SPIO|nr:hypothetical protein [Alkalispirochaeta americana]SIQ52559.1 hypothetical protein SAMN05920897_11054 [Alkalispirochaeta americana]